MTHFLSQQGKSIVKLDVLLWQVQWYADANIKFRLFSCHWQRLKYSSTLLQVIKVPNFQVLGINSQWGQSFGNWTMERIYVEFRIKGGFAKFRQVRLQPLLIEAVRYPKLHRNLLKVHTPTSVLKGHQKRKCTKKHWIMLN